MAYDFHCPECGYGHHADESNLPENEIGEFPVSCYCCKAEMVVTAMQVIEYEASPVKHERGE